MLKEPRILITGGGTGGHIFPAVSIANAVKGRCPGARILFVGALGRMEMERVPAAGYEIRGLPVRGLIRPLYSPRNIGVMIDFFKAVGEVKRLLSEFCPDVAVGVGGYASAPTLNAAYSAGIPCLIQEQNSFAGVTNRSLAKKATRICVAYEGMERFFPKGKLLLTGNPVRQDLYDATLSKTAALARFGLKESRPTILLIGGSLGARTLNESVLAAWDDIREANVNFIWQTGSYYKDTVKARLARRLPAGNIVICEFVSDMCAAYAAADLVVSRAGAGSISELCLLAKPSILVPSPNVAEDHQTHNALALVNKGAALMVRDNEARATLITVALETVVDGKRLSALSKRAGRMAKRDAADVIAREVLALANRKS
ncbi:MAG: undecaprenyldiphospho-muramoylpentapeptide beta-N-acetylglucosaminyltransferase [Prevotella sp.]|nr:undecaprenyldiphospho-muramoylpentapeptide beta-N-acetylglucosaminyltransferase [Prevotella sp.]